MYEIAKVTRLTTKKKLKHLKCNGKPPMNPCLTLDRPTDN